MGVMGTSKAPVIRETRATRLRKQALEQRWGESKEAEKAKQVAKVRTHIERGRKRKKNKRGLDASAPRPLRRSLEQSKSKPTSLSARRRFRLRRLRPPFGPTRLRGPVEAVNTNGTACMMHGIPLQYLREALTNRELTSTYARTGEVRPTDEGRGADKIGGGSTAVYTRAVGVDQDFPAKGHGVGHSVVPAANASLKQILACRVQLILSPEILNDPEHTWRASAMDNMGKIPDAPPLTREDKYLSDEDRAFKAWSGQSEAGRNKVFNGTVQGNKARLPNEQLHYMTLPLENVLKGMVVTSQAVFDELIRECGGEVNTDPNVPRAGTIRMGDVEIPIIIANGEEPLVQQLKDAKIADANGRVR